MLRRHYLENRQTGQIHYVRSGCGERILLLHQTPRSWDEFREVIPLLNREFELIAMDLPGMGASDAIAKKACIKDYASAAAQLVEHVGGPLTVCGHHTGGVVAIELAASRPELVEGLILSSTPWIGEAERRARATKTPIDTATHVSSGEHIQSYWAQRAPYYPDNPVYLDRFLKDALSARDASEGHHAVSAYEMEKKAPAVSVPTLIVEHSSDPFAKKHTDEIQSAFPLAETQKIEEGGVPLEVTANAFAAIVAAWMKKTSDQRAARTKEEVKA